MTIVHRNVLNEPLEPCCYDPVTGFYRDGFCRTDKQDYGQHTICAEMTDDFLRFTRAQGNDLSTPQPAYGFPGLKAGDRWCLCVLRWKEALQADVAPPVILAACHASALHYVSLEQLLLHAVCQPS